MDHLLVSLLGLLGKSATQPVITGLTEAAPGSVRQIVHNARHHASFGRQRAERDGLLATVAQGQVAMGCPAHRTHVAAERRSLA